jgi:hypothetical protein
MWRDGVTPQAQFMDALERANEVRLGRAATKRAVKDGSMSIVAALGEPCCATMLVFDLLCAQRRWGDARSCRLLRTLGYQGVVIGRARRIENLTVRERTALAEALKRTTA